MSNIIISCATLGSGGAERVLSILSTPLSDRYDFVTYIMWIDAPLFYPIDSRVKLICVEKEADSRNEIKKMRWFRSYIKRNNPDLLLSLLAPYNLRVLISILGLEVNVIVADRNDPRALWGGKLVSYIRDILYCKANGILVQSKTNKDFYKGSLGKKTDIIYNPVSIEPTQVGQALKVLKKHKIVSVARLEPWKRHDLTIKVFKRFLETYPDYIFDIYGIGGDKERLQILISELGLENNVHLKGESKNVLAEICDAELFLLTSTHEGMSNAMIEAMCMGLPCICTKVSGALDLIKSGENGVLIDINDEHALYENMCKVILNKKYAYQLGKNATAIYNDLKTEVISEKWINYINNHIK